MCIRDRAAAALGQTKAVVSFNVRQLENELGVTLLLRSTRRLRLTDAGALFYQRGVALLKAAENLQDEAVSYTHLDVYKRQADQVIPQKDPRGNTLYWIGPPGDKRDAGPGTDFAAVDEGYVSVTPLHVDLTAHQAHEVVTDWLERVGVDRQW